MSAALLSGATAGAAAPAPLMGTSPQSVSRSGLVREESGRAGPFAIGEAASRYEGWLRRLTPTMWVSYDGIFLARTDENGTLREILAWGPEVFTQRFVSMGKSTVYDVLSSYGVPAATRLREGVLTMRYPAYSFLAAAPASASTSDVDTILPLSVSAIALTRSDRVVDLTLDQIRALQDGGPGSTEWSFHVFAGSLRVLDLGRRPYDDSGRPIAPTASQASASVDLAGPPTDRILRVLGYRTPNTARGRVSLADAAAGTSEVSVSARAPDPRQGTFNVVFNVTRTPVSGLPLGNGSRYDLEMSRIEVIQDGGVSSTRWDFEVYLNNRLIVDLPEARYDDSSSPSLPPGPLPRTYTALHGEQVILEVLAHRPPDTVEGRMQLAEEAPTSRRAETLPARARTAVNDGSFELTFSLQAPVVAAKRE